MEGEGEVRFAEAAALIKGMAATNFSSFLFFLRSRIPILIRRLKQIRLLSLLVGVIVV